MELGPGSQAGGSSRSSSIRTWFPEVARTEARGAGEGMMLPEGWAGSEGTDKRGIPEVLGQGGVRESKDGFYFSCLSLCSLFPKR